ncbi:MAG: prepilin-type N-terminal cleavage/methylation domain-containing protein [Proteobacteria bacterium]|nr:prepilin-type N-terminal cleavage/methylation domain-containing protein [Pseudomonadota bacterium]MBU1715172.1 prepilin-type N-terminal cleavage/methylation domain-containing protein [Pseudomonadota bacterium]
MEKSLSGPQNGFTLLEVMIVLLLIGLVTGLVVPRFGGTLSSMQARSAVKKIATILRYARNQAVSEQQTRVVTFDLSLNRVVLELAVDQIGEVSAERKKTDSADPGGKVYQLPEKIRLLEAISASGENIEQEFPLYFYPAGNSSGGVILLQGKRKSPYRLQIDFITGIVDVTD